MINKTDINSLARDVEILSKKVELLAQMFKDYVESEESAKLESGKWYKGIDSLV